MLGEMLFSVPTNAVSSDHLFTVYYYVDEELPIRDVFWNLERMFSTK